MALVDPSCFLGLPPEERRQQLYEALYTWAGDDTLTDPACFLGLTPEEQGMAMFDGVASGSAVLPPEFTWYQSQDPSAATTTENGDPSFTVWSRVMVGSGGTVKELGFHCSLINFNFSMRLSLWTSAGALIGIGTKVITTSDTAGWIDVSVNFPGITAGEYFVALSPNIAGGALIGQSDTGNPANSLRLDYSHGYANMEDAVMPGTGAANLLTVRVGIEA